nr:CBS domain-containing protein [Desulforamulus aquiferis]
MSGMITVGAVHCLITTLPKCVNIKASKQEILETMLNGSPFTRAVYVTSDDGVLEGIITLQDVLEGLVISLGYNPHEEIKTSQKLFKYSPFGTAGDIMKSPVFVKKIHH